LRRHLTPTTGIALQRLRTQRLAGAGFSTPLDVVRWFGAIQAQDYPGALWAVGMRTAGASEPEVEAAIGARQIVRTWPLRGTWHFVAAEDVRWMLTHVASRIVAGAARRFAQLELDARTFARSEALMVKALQGGRSLSRPQLYAVFERAGIATRNNRGVHILWRWAHDGLICGGVRQGKQHTFTLLDEWVPPAKPLDRDEALAELARRYFTSHGPATLKDFGWWSGLAAADARAAIEMAGRDLVRDPMGTTIYWHGGRTRGAASRTPSAPRVVLLPPYDEYTVAYRDRSAALDPAHAAAARNGIFSPTILIDGRIVGTWTRRLAGSSVTIALQPFAPLTGSRRRAVLAAAARYGRFIGCPVRLS
jgi:hypothetical protein